MSVSDLDRILASGDGEETTAEDEGRAVKLVVITLDDERFAFPGDCIKEILADRPVHFLPGSPAALEGIINLRGDIESVLSLRALLGREARAAGSASRILLGQTAVLRSGLRVDQVEDVLDVGERDILPPPPALPDSLRPLVIGITTIGGRITHILDLERLFADYRDGSR